MKTEKFIKLLAVFFFVLFTGTKVFGFHDLLHDHNDHLDQTEECLVCDKALLDEFSPLESASQSSEISEVSKEFHTTLNNEYSLEFSSTELFTVLFSRPPPAL